MLKEHNKILIDKISPHTIKKFELVEEYIKSWASNLMLNDYCNTLIFIDCMCNSGIYIDEFENLVEGTPVRVSKVLLEVARENANKNIEIYLNDIDANKVKEIKKHLPCDEGNFKIITYSEDASEFLKTIGPQFYNTKYLQYFLLYDPYDANINWKALLPFFRNTGEVLINHMVSDPIRAIKCAKKGSVKEKYENTYLKSFEKLMPYGSDKSAYELRVEEIIRSLKRGQKYFIAAFPFFNSQNTQIYSLVHCTSIKENFELYKDSAWRVFGGKSSTKKSSNIVQFSFDFEGDNLLTVETDEKCFNVRDIAKYINQKLKGERFVPLSKLWNLLEKHPIFPSNVFHDEILGELKNIYGIKIEYNYNLETNRNEELISFF